MDLRKIVAGYESVTKAKEIISSGVDVSPEEMAEVYASAANIKKVVVHCHHPKFCVNIGGGANLIKGLSKEDKVFFEKGGSNALVVYAFPDAKKAIESLYAAVRIKTKNCCVGGSNLMEVGTFERDFLPYLQKKKEVLEEILEGQVRAVYDLEIEKFEEMAMMAASSLDTSLRDDVAREVAAIKRRDPEDLIKGFGITLETDFPAEAVSSTEYQEVLRAAKREFVVREGMSLIGGMVSELWEAGLRFTDSIKSCEDEDLTVGKYNTARNRLRERALKVQRENPKAVSYIDTLCRALIEVSKDDYLCDAQTDIAQVLALLYNEGKKLELELPFSLAPEWVTKEGLEYIFETIELEE